MLRYSKSDFAEVDLNASPQTIAKQFHTSLKKYWKTVPEHPLYQDEVPIDGGYCDAHIAILRHYLEHEAKLSEICKFTLQRVLIYLELDPPSEFVDKQGLVLNQFSKKDQERLDDGVIFGRELIATLDEMVKMLNQTNKLRENHFSFAHNSEKRKKYYDSLVLVPVKNTRDYIITNKRKLILQYTSEQAGKLKDFFIALTENYLFLYGSLPSIFILLTKEKSDLFIRELKNNQINLDANHPLLRQTPLTFAIECEVIEAVSSLIMDANINLPDETGRCPIHYAVKSGNFCIFNLLAKANVNLCVIDRDDWTPLHYAVRYLSSIAKENQEGDNKKEDRIKILDLILEKCDIKLLLHRDRMGRTALHYAKALELDDALIQKLYFKLDQLAGNRVDEIKEKLLDKEGFFPQELKVSVYSYDSSKIEIAPENDRANYNPIVCAAADLPPVNSESSLTKMNLSTSNNLGVRKAQNKYEITRKEYDNSSHENQLIRRNLAEREKSNALHNQLKILHSSSGLYASSDGSHLQELEKLRGENSALREENINLKEENRQLKKEISQLNMRMDEIQQQAAKTDQKAQETQMMVYSLMAAISNSSGSQIILPNNLDFTKQMSAANFFPKKPAQ